MADRTVRVRLTANVREYTSSVRRAAEATDDLNRKAENFDGRRFVSKLTIRTGEAKRDLNDMRRGLAEFGNLDPDATLKVNTAQADKRLHELLRELDYIDTRRVSPEVELKTTKTRTEVNKLSNELDELSKKQSTPEVDAKVAEASAKLRNLLNQLHNIDEIYASPTVTADTSKARVQLNQLRDALDAIERRKVEPKVELRTAQARSEAIKLEQELDRLSQMTATPEVEARIAEASAKLKVIEQEFRDLEAQRAKVTVTADTAAAHAEVNALDAELSRIDGETVSPEIALKYAKARSQLADMRSQLTRLGSQEATPEVKVRIAEAVAKVRVLRAELNRLDGKTYTAKAKVDTKEALIGTRAIVSAVTALGPAAVTAGAIAAGGIGGLAPLLATAGSAAGVTALAFTGVGDAITKVNKAALDPTKAKLKNARIAMEQLSQAGRNFVNTIRGDIQPAIKQLKGTAQEGLLPGVTEGLEQLVALLPDVDALVDTTAKALGDLAAQGGAALNSPFWRDFIGFLKSNARPTLMAFGDVLGNLAKGFAGLTIAFDPVADDFIRGLQRMSQQFKNWATTLDSNQGFQHFVEYVQQNGPLLIDTIGKIVSAAGSIVSAIEPIGPTALKALGALADLIKLIADSPLGPPLIALASGLAAVNTALKVQKAIQYSPVIGKIRKGFLALTPAVSAATPAISGVGTAASASQRKLVTLAPAASKAATSFKGVGSAAGLAKGGIVTLGPAAASASSGFGTAAASGGKASTAFRTVARVGGAVARNLPLIGAAALIAVSAFDGLTTSASEAADGLQKTGRAGSQFRDSLREADATLQQNRETFGDWFTDASIATDRFFGLASGSKEANRAFQEQLKTMTPLNAATARASKAQGDYDDAVIKFGQNSPQAIQALQRLHGAQAAVTVQQQLANKSGLIYYQTLGKLAGQAGPAGDAARRLASNLDFAGLSAAGATVKIDATGKAVAVLPSGKRIDIQANGRNASVQIQAVSTNLDKLPAGKTVNVGVIGQPAINALRGIGIEVHRLPDGTVEVTAPTEKAKASLVGIANYARTHPGVMDLNVDIQRGLQSVGRLQGRANQPQPGPSVGAIITQGRGNIIDLQQLANRAQPGPAVSSNPAQGNANIRGMQANANVPQPGPNVSSNPAPGNANIGAMQRNANSPQPGPNVSSNPAQGNANIGAMQRNANRPMPGPNVSANTSPANAAISALRAAWNGVTWTVNIVARKLGFAAGGIAQPMATGGVVRDVIANDAGNNLYNRSFDGHKLRTMPNTGARMVNPGTWRVVGDRLDVPELYAPLDGSGRSLSLISQGAATYGKVLVDAASIYGQQASRIVDRLGSDTPEIHWPMPVNIPRILAQAEQLANREITNYVTVNNPIAERASDDIERGLSRLADLGLFGND